MEYFYHLDRIIREELEEGRTIAIYPFGKIGMQAKEILEQRYGGEAILIDNKLAKYNKAVRTIEEFLETDNSNVTVFVCVIDRKVNSALLQTLQKNKIGLKIRNVLEPRGAYVTGKEEYFQQIKDLCRVKKSTEYALTRVGSNNDGGYIMLDDFKKIEIAYSFGIGNNIEWEEDVISKGMSVWGYDPTIIELPYECSGLRFHRIGITGKDKPTHRLYSLETILKENGHSDKENLILKMDVEGAEWDFLQEVSNETLAQFNQISLELHKMTDMENKDKVLQGLQKLRETHEPVWIHGNSGGSYECSGNIIIPNAFEITYVKKAVYNLADTSYHCPIDLDNENVETFFDIVLEDWGTVTES